MLSIWDTLWKQAHTFQTCYLEDNHWIFKVQLFQSSLFWKKALEDISESRTFPKLIKSPIKDKTFSCSAQWRLEAAKSTAPWTACAAPPALLHTQDTQGWDDKKVLGKSSINKKVAAGQWEGGGRNSILTFMAISYRVLSKSDSMQGSLPYCKSLFPLLDMPATK